MSDRVPKLNRNSSMLNSSLNNPISPYPGYHSLTNGADASPLKLFSQAKQAINSIYHEFHLFIDEIYAFLDCKFLIFNFLRMKYKNIILF